MHIPFLTDYLVKARKARYEQKKIIQQEYTSFDSYLTAMVDEERNVRGSILTKFWTI